MSAQNFNDAVARVLRFEGGYVRDANDPGGETNFGISKRAYPTLDIRSLTMDQAKLIYLSDYWDKCYCDELPTPLDVLVFDAAVNQGVHAAIIMMQRVIGVQPDGIVGPVTLKTAERVGQGAAAEYLTERALRYLETPNSGRYLKGWMNRLFGLALGV